ncbi:hypothetical protein COJ48_16565 [Bacillus cereus]|nr:hypothetical protein COJ48_16565 [Bacillus cereus]PGP77738.1 hypothetical protein CN997_20745 [Bacillus cereus]
MFNIQQIKEIIPHRYPLLLIDWIIEVEEGERAVWLKNVVTNEVFFTRHFSDYSVVISILIVDALLT